jgi:hypothetical protein
MLRQGCTPLVEVRNLLKLGISFDDKDFTSLWAKRAAFVFGVNIYNLFRSFDHSCHPMVHYDITLPE